MKNAITILALVTLIALPFRIALPKDNGAKEAVKQFKKEMKKADEGKKVSLIQELAKAHPDSKEAADAVSKYTGDRSDKVKIAAINALGTFKDKRQMGRLMMLLKYSDKKPKIMVACLNALGEIANPRILKEVSDVANLWLFKKAEVAKAAAEAIGNIKSPAAVDELIHLLDLTYPHQTKNGPTISQQERNLLAKSRPSIIDGLQKLTGWDFTSARIWKNFWKKEKTRWHPDASKPDLTKIKTYREPGFCFDITLPGKGWVFSRDPKDKSIRITMSISKQNMMQAAIDVIAYDQKDFQALTVQQKAQQQMDAYRGKNGKANAFQDIKEKTLVQKPLRMGRDRGFLQSFVGMNSHGLPVRQKNIFVVHNECMYAIYSWVRSGADKKIADQVQKGLDSFRFTD